MYDITVCVLFRTSINSLAPGRFNFNFRQVIFKLILVNGGWGISYEIALRWMPLDLTDDKSTLVQVMAWCRQATSHYLSQCRPRSLSPNGVTRHQWVNDNMSWVVKQLISPANLINGLLTHCVLSGWLSGMLPNGTKPLPEPILINHQWSLLAFTRGQFRKKCSKYLFLKCDWI